MRHRGVDKLEDMPGAIRDVADEFAVDTAQLIKKLTGFGGGGDSKTKGA